MMQEGLEEWKGSKKLKEEAAIHLRNHLLAEYAESNRLLFEGAKHMHKAIICRARFNREHFAHQAIVTGVAETNKGDDNNVVAMLSCDVSQLLKGELPVKKVLEDYRTYLATNRAVYATIVGHHEAIKTPAVSSSSSSSSSPLESGAATSLKGYAYAASRMGAKAWVLEANEWMWAFALSFFRRNGAKRDFLQHARQQHELTGREKDNELAEYLARANEILAKDLMACSSSSSVRKIRLLDVGSCYNPILRSDTSRQSMMFI